MESEADRLFVRWRERGDVQALARVFDLAAPGLMRLALHFVGDVNAAEDLVQATFVTAMERAATFEAGRALDPWLAGILTNHARGSKRDARRTDTTADIESRLELDLHTPLDSVLAAEESAAVAKAVDELPEPYRAVLLLRLRHGMKDADIAHVLDRSPGAVRVQLHRGREMLRKLLPASLVASALLLESGRGLAAVKAEVLVAGSSHVAATVGVTGGVLVGKKLAGVVALCAFLLFALVAWKALGISRADDDRVVAGGGKVDGLENSTRAEVDAPISAPVAREEASPTAASADLVDLPGRVIDSTTRTGIAGARVELYPPRRTTMFQLQERSVGRARPSFTSEVHGYPWPSILDDLSDLQRAGREPFDVYEAPAVDMNPLAVTITDSDGAFTFRCDKALGFIVCAAKGFETRTLPVKPYEKVYRGGIEQKLLFESCEILMTHPRRFFGYLVDPKGDRVARKMKLEVSGHWDGPKEPQTGTIKTTSAETWIIETQPDGNFDCEVGVDTVWVHSAEPGVGTTTSGLDPLTHQRRTYRSDFHPGQQTEPARIIVVPWPCLIVREKSTQKPIERFFVRSTALGSGTSFEWSGCFFAKGGRLALIEDQQPDQAWVTNSLKTRHDFTVWCEGFSPTVVRIDDMTTGGETLVELERGEVPKFHGRVHEGPSPLADIPVVMVSRSGAMYDYYYGALDATRTDARGEFEIPAPNGSYTLRFTRGSEVECVLADMPTSTPIDVDFGVPTTIRAHVRDGAGNVCASHTLGIRNHHDRFDRVSKTDAQGIVEWTRLHEGDYEINVPFDNPIGSFRADDVIKIKELRRGEVRDVDITIPLSNPRFAHLVVDGVNGAQGWKASGSIYSDVTDWQDVAPDGRIPVDIQRGVPDMNLLALDGRTWKVPLPKNAPDGYVIRIETEGPGYEGVLTSLVDGSPMRNVRIKAWVRGEVEEEVRSCVTDAVGHFRLPALGAGKCRFSFGELDSDGMPGRSLDNVGFSPVDVPAVPLVRLEIGLPRMKNKSWEGMPSGKVTGHVRCSGTQRSVFLWVTGEWSVPGGTMSCSSSMTTEKDGEFVLEVPLVRHYRASISDSQSRLGSFEWDESAPAAVMQRDFDVK